MTPVEKNAAKYVLEQRQKCATFIEDFLKHKKLGYDIPIIDLLVALRKPSLQAILDEPGQFGE